MLSLQKIQTFFFCGRLPARASVRSLRSRRALVLAMILLS